MNKKLFAMLLMLALCVLGLTLTASAAEKLTSGDFEYEVHTDGSVVILGYIGTDVAMTIPSEIDGIPVGYIGNNAFWNRNDLTSVTFSEGCMPKYIGTHVFNNCSGLKNITIPDSVTTIGQGAFNNCEALESVNIPNGVTTINQETFAGCKALKSIIIPNSVTTIGSKAFYNCGNLTSVTIGNSVTTIAESAFSNTGLTTITIPDSVTTIGQSAFEGCTALDTIIYQGTNPPVVGSNAIPTGATVKVPAGYNGTFGEGTVSIACAGCGLYPVDDDYKTKTHTKADCGIIGHYACDGKNHAACASVEVTVTVSPEGSGTVTGAGTYEKDTSVTLTATPKTGYKFVNWMQDNTVVSDNAEYTFTVGNDCNLTAHFEHEHSWSYSATGDTVTASCSVENCVVPEGTSITATIAKPALTEYKGSGNENATVTTPVNTYGAFDTLSSVSYQKKNDENWESLDSAPTNAGDYKASITAGNATAYVEYTIEPRTIEDTMVSLSANSFVYNESEQQVSVTVKDGIELTLDIDYKLTGKTQATDVSTGNGYEVTITGKGNYVGTVKMYWTITKATMNVTATGYSGTYDGTPHGITVTAPEGATVTYSTDGGTTYSAENPVYTDVTNSPVTVNYKVTKANYEDVTGSATVTITQKEITVSGITAKNKTYDGTTTAKLDYSNVNFGGIVTDDILTVTAAGTFDNANAGTDKTVVISNLTLGGNDAGNYILATSGQQTSTTANINKAAQAAPATPELESSTSTMIKVKEIAADPVKVDVKTQYACIKSNATPAENDWQPSNVFENLEKNTTYYVFARYNKGTNYTASPESAALQVETHNVCSIVFKTQGGSAVATITQDCCSPVTAPAAPTKAGHTFMGWNPALPSVMPEAEKTTLTAIWNCSDSRDLDNHKCDIAGCSLRVANVCWDDNDGDHACNECGKVLQYGCVDDDRDHYCDFCPIQLTTCNDARDDIDHLCDLCGAQVANPEPCWDNTSLELDVDGHICNAIGCGKKIDPSVKDFCWDYDKDGKCEECGWVIGSPVVTPTAAPTTAPTVAPTAEPTVAPTAAPTVEPTVAPTVAPTAEPTVAPTTAPTVAPKYGVAVDGKNGTITRTNDTSVYYKDTYIRYSIGYEMGGTSYAVIAMLKVDWTETQEGAVGTFTIPRIQGSGTVTGASYIVTTNADADGLSIAGAAKDAYGMLIQ